MQNIIHAIIVFGGGLALLLSLVQLLQSVRDRRALLLFLIFFSITMLQLYFYLQVYSTGGTSTLILAEYLLGPGIYLFYQSIFNTSYQFNLRVLLHFLPTGFFIFMGVLFWIFPWFFDKGPVVDFLRNWEIFEFIQSAGIMVIIVYLMVILFRLYPANVAQRGRPALTFSIAMTMITLFLAIMLLLVISLFRRELLWRKVAMVLTSLVVIYWFIMSQLNPAIFLRGAGGKRKKKKQADLEKKPDLEERLQLLLGEEKLFCDEDLSLGKLAALANTTPHQLSAYLNNHLQVNFNQYINGFRIDEAITIMKVDPERSLLSIAFGVGFNSKSSFYDVFTRITGQSPARFRQNL